MKGKLEDGTPVEIEKPEPIEQDGKWWEFNEFRCPLKAEKFLELYDNPLIINAPFDFHRHPYWIASEISRATADQLRAIGMKERDGRPVVVKIGDNIWSRTGHLIQACNCLDCKNEIGHYRFVLVRDVQKETHSECDGCIYQNEAFPAICSTCGCGKNHTTKHPAQPDEPRFNIREIVDYCIERQILPDDRRQGFINEFSDITEGLAAFTERRRE